MRLCIVVWHRISVLIDTKCIVWRRGSVFKNRADTRTPGQGDIITRFGRGEVGIAITHGSCIRHWEGELEKVAPGGIPERSAVLVRRWWLGLTFAR